MGGLQINSGRLLIVLVALLAASTAQAQFNITGVVTGPGATPVNATEIRLFTGTGVPIGIPLTLTNLAGSYTIPSLPSGSYIVQFRPPIATKLIAVELPVTVVASNATRNAALQAGHLFSGYVRDPNGVGIPSIDLQMVDRDTDVSPLIPGDDTDASGFYDVVVPTGEYDLEWRAVAPGSPPYIPVTGREFIDGDFTLDVTMVLGAFVSGTVTDSFGSPVSGVNLDFVDATTGVKADTPGDNTALNGAFTAQVPLGTFTVVTKPQVADRLVAGVRTGVVVAGDVTGLDFVLQPGVILSGTVSGPGGVIEGVDVDVSDALTGADIEVPFDVTGPTGLYQVVVPTGQFDVVFQPPTATVLAPKRVAAVTVAADRVLNTTLQQGVVFSGTVTSGGAPVSGVDIDLKNPVTGVDEPLVGDGTNGQGVFSTVVVPGTYILEIEPNRASNLVAQRLANFTISGTLNLPVSLVSGARVTGLVTNSQGLPMPDINVDALRSADGVEMFTPGDHTDANGLYQVVVPLDSYSFKYKLGASYAVSDSMTLVNQVVNGDRVINVEFIGAVTAVEDDTPAALGVALKASPNPFNPTTTITFAMPRTGRARVSIHGLDGRLVTVLTDRKYPAGDHAVVWSGRDSEGRTLSSGVYLMGLKTQDGVRTGKLVLLK